MHKMEGNRELSKAFEQWSAMTQHARYLHRSGSRVKDKQSRNQAGGRHNKPDGGDDGDEQPKELGQRNRRRKRQMEEMMKDRIKITLTW